MKAKFIKFTKGDNWVSGVIEGEESITFEAKLFDEGSEYGINRRSCFKIIY